MLACCVVAVTTVAEEAIGNVCIIVFVDSDICIISDGVVIAFDGGAVVGIVINFVGFVVVVVNAIDDATVVPEFNRDDIVINDTTVVAIVNADAVTVDDSPNTCDEAIGVVAAVDSTIIDCMRANVAVAIGVVRTDAIICTAVVAVCAFLVVVVFVVTAILVCTDDAVAAAEVGVLACPAIVVAVITVAAVIDPLVLPPGVTPVVFNTVTNVDIAAAFIFVGVELIVAVGAAVTLT